MLIYSDDMLEIQNGTIFVQGDIYIFTIMTIYDFEPLLFIITGLK